MEKIKLVAIDIGGTLITDDNKITNENITTIKKLKEINVKIALVTARMYSSTKYIIKQIDVDYGVFGNGSCIMDLKNLKPIYTEIIPKDLVSRLVEYGKKENMYIHLNRLLYETSDEKKYFYMKHLILNKKYPTTLKSNIELVPNLVEYTKKINDVVKLVYVSENIMDDLERKLKIDFPNIYITEINKNNFEKTINKNINYIEVGITNINKYTGLKKLMKFLKIKEEEVLVIGDGDNDVEMLKCFSKSASLSNGTLNAKKYAKYVSQKNNNESGVSEILNYYIQEVCK